jgi:hypothetical protein
MCIASGILQYANDFVRHILSFHDKLRRQLIAEQGYILKITFSFYVHVMVLHHSVLLMVAEPLLAAPDARIL